MAPTLLQHKTGKTKVSQQTKHGVHFICNALRCPAVRPRKSSPPETGETNSRVQSRVQIPVKRVYVHDRCLTDKNVAAFHLSLLTCLPAARCLRIDSLRGMQDPLDQAG